MTYYAVTNDPNELMHFGIKGMKWGVRRTDAQLGHPNKPRSAAYKKAQSKLSKAMQNGIDKAKTSWKAYNAPEARYERQTNRAIEKARKGKLKYGKLTDDQVRRVTERLAMEKQARALSDSESTFRHRLAASVGAGVISGIGAGTSAVVAERIKRRSNLKTKRKEAKQNYKFETKKMERQLEFDNYKADRDEAREIRKADRDEALEIRKADRNEALEIRKDNRRIQNARQEKLLDEQTRGMNAKLYGAKYADGKLTNEDEYYNNRYVIGKTLDQQERERHRREQKERRAATKRAKREWEERFNREIEQANIEGIRNGYSVVRTHSWRRGRRRR